MSTAERFAVTIRCNLPFGLITNDNFMKTFHSLITIGLSLSNIAIAHLVIQTYHTSSGGVGKSIKDHMGTIVSTRTVRGGGEEDNICLVSPAESAGERGDEFFSFTRAQKGQ